MATLTIPLTTLTVGVHDFGPVALTTQTQTVLTIDRTVAGGLNSLLSTSTVTIDILVSFDNGSTFDHLAGGLLLGGVLAGVKDPNHNVLTVSIPPGSPSQAEARITVTGTSIAVAGSLVVT